MRQELKRLMVIVLLFFIWEVTAEEVPDGTIYGHVYDADTKQTLSQAFVYCQEETECNKPTTDKEGYYAFNECLAPSKTYTIVCTRFGYETSKNSIITDQQGGAKVDFSLQKKGIKSNKNTNGESNGGSDPTLSGKPIVSSSYTSSEINASSSKVAYFTTFNQGTFVQNQSNAASARGNELWIEMGADWRQYAIVTIGTPKIKLIAYTPSGGQADYNEILQTNSLNATSKRYQFSPGYNSIYFAPDKVGRHTLSFVLNVQPSNSIIIDVVSQAPVADQIPPSSNMPPAYNQPNAGQTTTTGLGQTTTSTSTQYQTYGTSYPPQTGGLAGDTPVTIQSQGMRGYQVFLDEVLIGTEGTGGDAPDGKFSFKVIGNQNHNVRVFDGQFNYPKSMYFQRGVLKIINVEAGTAVYI